MAKIGNVQKKIHQVEGFGVRFKHQYNGRDVMDNKQDIRLYPFKNAAPSNISVSDWKQLRFKKYYIGFDVDVLDSGNKKVNGRTLLKNLRASYE